MSKLASTGNSGFRLTFENKWAVSVQFSPYSYCERRSFGLNHEDPMNNRHWESPNAEVAVILPDGEFLQSSDDEEYKMDWMMSHISPDDVSKITAAISSLNEKSTEQAARILINMILKES